MLEDCERGTSHSHHAVRSGQCGMPSTSIPSAHSHGLLCNRNVLGVCRLSKFSSQQPHVTAPSSPRAHLEVDQIGLNILPCVLEWCPHSLPVWCGWIIYIYIKVYKYIFVYIFVYLWLYYNLMILYYLEGLLLMLPWLTDWQTDGRADGHNWQSDRVIDWLTGGYSKLLCPTWPCCRGRLHHLGREARAVGQHGCLFHCFFSLNTVL